MKKLSFKDSLKLARMLNKNGLKKPIKELVEKSSNTNMSAEEIGKEVIVELFFAIGNEGAEQDIYELLASPFEMTTKEVENLSLDELKNKIVQLAKENDLASFFSSAIKLN